MALQEIPCVPSSPHKARPFSACHLPQLDLAAVEEEEEEEEAEAVVVEGPGVEVEVITGSTLTPASPTCSRALSRSTWTRCTSGRLTWRDRGTAQDTQRGTAPRTAPRTGTDLIPTHTRTHTHTGSHRPT